MCDDPFQLKNLVDSYLPENDGFESYLFRIGQYNNSVGPEFQLEGNADSAGLLILSTPAMFDISFRRWVVERVNELGSLDNLSEQISSPIQDFMSDRLDPLTLALRENSVRFELLHDHSMWPNRRPKILMQTAGHVSGAAFYYQPKQVFDEQWTPSLPLAKNSKFIGLSLHPVYGGHFAFRSVFLFPNASLSKFAEEQPLSILGDDDEIRSALERFNYSWKDSKFRDFGGPKIRYSSVQMEFFGKPPAERWSVLRDWI